MLSIESASEAGWLSMRALTEAVDSYAAAHGVNDKPRVFAVDQTPQTVQPPHTVPRIPGVQVPRPPPPNVTSSMVSPGTAGGEGW